MRPALACVTCHSWNNSCANFIRGQLLAFAMECSCFPYSTEEDSQSTFPADRPVPVSSILLSGLAISASLEAEGKRSQGGVPWQRNVDTTLVAAFAMPAASVQSSKVGGAKTLAQEVSTVLPPRFSHANV